ncbi:class F sortase [Embleya sp. NPDC020630]|uniref:class F sortase n=1 Tax=Embleya sp. NPDC020630 TaxID=3363979 RepID=UPI0037A4DB23
MEPEVAAEERAAKRGIGPVGAGVVAMCLGVALLVNGTGTPGPPPQPGVADVYPDEARPAPHDPPPLAPLPAAAPTRVRIPAIGVDAPLTGLDLESGGRLAAPPTDEPNLAGWYRKGTPPGAGGTAIVAGHVDTDQGPAVFYHLGALHRGNTVEVDRADGGTAVFTIDAIEVYRAEHFPNRRVYGATKTAELRLITCGGGFDQTTRRYVGNVVAFAHLTSHHT